MSKHYQESEIEFRRENEGMDYPCSRGIIVHQYGGDAEDCIKEARKTFNLGVEWKVIHFEEAAS